MRAAVIRGEHKLRPCLSERTHLLQSPALTGQKYASVTGEQTNPLLTVGFSVGGREERELDEIAPRSHEHTHIHVNHLMFLLVTKEMGFSLASRAVSLQHVAMATGKLLKGLTASHQCSGFHTTVFAV